jgi:hydroxymethylbilane synthase
MPLAHARSAAEVAAERMVSRMLGGSCRVPLAAWCVTEAGGGLRLVARVAAEDGSELLEVVESCAEADLTSAERIGEKAARRLLDQGAARWLGSS